jgi:pilus assembly protein CpaF
MTPQTTQPPKHFEVRVESGTGLRMIHLVSEGTPFVIGRQEGCDIRLNDDLVSRQHAVVCAHEGGVRVRDLSSNGTGAGRLVLRGEETDVAHGTPIFVGTHRVVVLPTRDRTHRSATSPVGSSADEVAAPAGGDGTAFGGRTSAADGALRRELHRRLLDYLDLGKLDANKLDDPSTRPRVLAGLRTIIESMKERIPPEVDRDLLLGELADEALGLGPLERFLNDPSVSEIMVSDPDTIYIETRGRLLKTDAHFTDDERARAVIERIVTPLGRRIDESSPLVDARLKDGSRVNAIIRPLAVRGSCITIRKFPASPLAMDDFLRLETLDERMARFLVRCVLARKNVIISGGTGSGKTTLLNVLSASIPGSERIVTIEDAAELRLKQPHVVSLEARPANMEGKGQYTIRDLVANALRMRPDRIIVGECRGGEALDMLQAMNTGHDGSLTTTHANSPAEAVARLETLCLMSGVDLPSRAIREQIAASIDVVVQQARYGDGTRRISAIAEVAGLEDGEIALRPLFEFVRSGMDERGRVLGAFQATGYLPSFLHQFVVMSLIKPGEPYL